MKDNCDLFNSNPLWKRASDNNIQEYTYIFDNTFPQMCYYVLIVNVWIINMILIYYAGL